MNKDFLKPPYEYFSRYIDPVENIDVLDALKKYGEQYLAADEKYFTQLGDLVYEPGKWTIKDILQHIIDVERIFAYRALRIARKDKTPLPSFDQDPYVENALANQRSIKDLLDEFILLRKATINMYEYFNNDMLLAEGTCSEKTMSPLAIGYVLAGHVIHHMNILKERYYPLIS